MCQRLLCWVLIAFAAPLFALPGDRDQPIHIAADKAVRDEKKGLTVYSGNVQMRQGTMELEADKLTIYHTGENADQIIAQGNPAKMRQQPDLDKGLVHAHAGVITYFKNQERVLLQTDAHIERDGDLVTGDSINYLIDQQLISAESDKSRDGDKVIVVLQPTPQSDTQTIPVAQTAPDDRQGTITPQDAPTEAATATLPQAINEGVSGTIKSE